MGTIADAVNTTEQATSVASKVPEGTSGSSMIAPLTRLLALACFLSLLAPGFIRFTAQIRSREADGSSLASVLLFAAMSVAVAGVSTTLFYGLMKKAGAHFEAAAQRQSDFLGDLDSRYVDIAIIASAALSLFLELAVIRWQSTVFEFFAFYKNFGLLSCFAGLGLGYALAGRKGTFLFLSIPLLVWQFVFMFVLRYAWGGSVLSAVRAIPFREQLNMGVGIPDIIGSSAVYFLLAVIFLLTVLAFLPIGQLCGRLMQRRTNLKAYGLNLLGSLAGILAMLLVSFLWTPPVVWFAVCCAVILWLHFRTPKWIISGAGFSLAAMMVLAWPVDLAWQRIYSPYQLLEVGHSDSGLPLLRAAGHYFQAIVDLRPSRTEADLQPSRTYYDLPYGLRVPLQDVLIVGAGTGNDVAAAIRSGAARIDAVEIDPAIQAIGREVHPEKPYSNPRVHTVINDARSFLRTTDRTYDEIVYGVLDSHTVLSQASSVRLDSFVYTVEGLRDARKRLTSNGILSLSFALISPDLGRKIYLMMQAAFDGRAPYCAVIKGGPTAFIESNDQNWRLPASVWARPGLFDGTSVYADPSLHADVSTDDWPFFYMPRRVYPASYLIMVLQVLLLSSLVTGAFVRALPRRSHLSFFFLGAGFMLVETKAVTEMGLTFGNTWQVIGIVIACILIMAFLANCVVQYLGIKRSYLVFVVLLATLILGWWIAKAGGLSSTTAGRLETAVLLTSPLFFSGIIFSSLLSSNKDLTGMMAFNLLGAICGGLLEYNSMYFGFQFLYLIALGCYALAFVSSFSVRPGRKAFA